MQEKENKPKLHLAITLSLSVLTTPALTATTLLTLLPQSQAQVDSKNELAGITAVKPLTNFVAPVRLTDSFYGQDKPSPYVLSFKNILTDEILVFVDGQPLSSDAYKVDSIKGEISFTQPLMQKSLARISYTYIRGKAERNAAPASAIPLAFSFSRLQIMAVPNAGNPLTVLGFNDKQQVLGGGLSSQIYYSAGGGDGTSPVDKSISKDGTIGRTGVKVGYGMGNDKNGLTASFLRAGREFAPTVGNNFGMANAQQNMVLGGRLAPASWMGASFNYNDNRDLKNSGAGGAGQAMALRLGGTVGLPSLNYAHNTEEKTDVKGVHTSSILDKTDFSGKMGLANVTALRQTQITENKDGKVTVGTEKANITTKLGAANLVATSEQVTTEKTTLSTDKLPAKTDSTDIKTDTLNLTTKVGPLAVNGGTQVIHKDDGKLDTNTQTKTLVMNGALSKITTVTANLQQSTNQSNPSNALNTLNTLNAQNALNALSPSATTQNNKSNTQVGKFTLQSKVGVASVGLERNINNKSDEKASTQSTQDKLNLTGQFGTNKLNVQSERVLLDGENKEATKSATPLTETETKTEIATDKVILDSKLSKNATLNATTEKKETNAPGKDKDVATQDHSIALTTSDKNSSTTFALINGSKTTTSLVESKQGFSLKLQATPRFILSAEQKALTSTPVQPDGSMGSPVNSMVQSGTAEIRPMEGTLFTGNVQFQSEQNSNMPTPTRWSQINQYTAEIGKEKSSLRMKGNFIDRNGTPTAPGVLPRDTIRAEINVKPDANFTFTSAYQVNPVEKDGSITPVQKQDWGLTAHLGCLELGGSYAISEFLSDAPLALMQKMGGRQYGEYSLKLGLVFSRYTRLTTDIKDSFFNNNNSSDPPLAPRGTHIVNLGVIHKVGSAVDLTIGGTMTENRAATGTTPKNEYKAEAKLGVKF